MRGLHRLIGHVYSYVSSLSLSSSEVFTGLCYTFCFVALSIKQISPLCNVLQIFFPICQVPFGSVHANFHIGFSENPEARFLC